MTAARRERQGAILRLIGEREISTQSELADALHEAGYEAVQTTVSRDIQELGLRKVRGSRGRLVYAPPGAADTDTVRELTQILRRTALYSGVVPLLVKPGADTDQMISNATAAALESGMVRDGDRVVVVAGVPVGRPGQTNLLKVETI